MGLYTAILRPLLFRFDAETAHHGTVEACRWLGAVPGVATLSRGCLEMHPPSLRTEVAGLSFTSPIGLAAGWDKSGRALRMIDSMGFGFAEIGSVSARPSRGNPRPRLFRLPQDRAIIVNYGLPNDGAEIVAHRLAAHRPRHPLGANIVKTNDGPDAPPCSEDDILADYERSVALLHPHADYLALNLSCPNAEGGKDFFATPGSITRLLERLSPLNVRCPVFLKVAPNPDADALERLVAEAEPFPAVRGFIFNLPAGKPDTLRFTVPRDRFAHQPGAVSGRPVASLINACIRELYRRMPRGRFAIIGTGGVFTAEDAYEKILLGASLVQLYTGAGVRWAVYYLFPVCEPGTTKPTRVETIRAALAAMLKGTSVIPPSMLVPLAKIQRSSFYSLQNNLNPTLQANLERLRFAPIILNADFRPQQLHLTEIRQAERGVGDHALTIFDTGKSFVFDQSHIFLMGHGARPSPKS